ncbi:N-acetyltransferase 10 [Clydaea vesicula]|uniref:RNA cytidine acetyltransferase n=1 Tax=Clydaea vesicula TaxID=447962 RepID=A0AAD5U4S8_9FUNG|nr:N-acetyltransferase 10 [Clydaea vesicula]
MIVENVVMILLDQVVTLHFLLSKARVAARPNVLWCYKKDLGFTSHRKKRARQIKSQIARGIRDADQDDPFELFVASTNVRYTYYKETEKILGNTYGMCVLQDFEAVTPNILARTIETVEGGGIVVLLLRTMKSLKQLYSMTMNDVLTAEQKELEDLKESLKDTQPIGALVSCSKTIDQAKAILTFVEATAEKTLRSTVSLTAARGRGKSAALGISLAAAVAYGYSNIFLTSPSPENLKTLFEFVFKGFDALGYEEHLDYDIIQSTNPAFQKSIVRVNIFRDHRQTIQYIQPQDHSVLSQAELLVIDEAAAIPLPIVKKLLGPYLVFMASTINGYEGTGRSLSLKLLKQLREQAHGGTKPTGENSDVTVVDRSGKETSGATSSGSRALREIQLNTPIRYGVNDPVEKWLNNLLCLDSSNNTASLFSNLPMKGNGPTGCPHPTSCELFYVNRDTLFSYHPVSEAFLQRMMALYSASHYKNTPDDLQLMSDAPAHHLFVLLPPIIADNSKTTVLPDPLVVLQVCMEGLISKESAIASLTKGVRAAGDMIPWVMSQQFQDEDFAQLSGARIVRIATHPDYVGMGYGKRAMELVEQYYTGKFIQLDESIESEVNECVKITDLDLKDVSLMTDEVKVRDPSSMPPLLLKLSERPLPAAENLHWIGVSYGLTAQLHKFWKRIGFVPLYVRQTENNITGEHTCIMLKELTSENEVLSNSSVKVESPQWLTTFSDDFKKRFIELLAYQFKKFSPVMVLSILEAVASRNPGRATEVVCSKSEVHRYFTPFDLKRLDSYTSNLLDYHVILDLASTLAHNYFLGQYNSSALISSIKPVSLSPVQSSIILGIGLQKKTMTDMERDLNLPQSQILALFGKVVKKCLNYLNEVVEIDVLKQVDDENAQLKKKVQTASNSNLSKSSENYNDHNLKRRNPEDEDSWDPTLKSLDDDLEDAGEEAVEKLLVRQKELINTWDLEKYAIGGTDEDWEKAKMGKSAKIVNIPNTLKSSKKLKQSNGTAVNLSQKLSGEKNGFIDPKNLVGSKKKGGKARSKKN